MLIPLPRDAFIVTSTCSKLRIRKPTPNDSGRYQVAVRNKYGEDFASVILRVVGKYIY